MNQINDKNIQASVNKKDQYIISIALLFGLFMPNGNLFYYLVPFVTLFLGMRYSKLNNSRFTTKYVLLVLMLISFILFSFTIFDSTDIKGLIRNIVLFELLFFFPFAKNVKIPNIVLYLALIYIFISQISYMIGIDSISSFFSENYPYEGDYIEYQSDYLKSVAEKMTLLNRDIRLGGLYINPNQCGRYLNIVFAVFLIENFNSKIKTLLPFLIIYAMAIVATGSRTGFFISIVIFTYYIYSKSLNKKNALKYISIFIPILIFIGFIFIVNSELTQTVRFLDYDEGLEKSLFYKINIFIDSIANSSFINLIFGRFSNDGPTSIMLDSEWGELIYRYGFVFFVSLILFYFQLFRKLSVQNRIILFILLWMVSSSVLMSYRTSFIFLLLLSKYSYSYLCPSMQKLEI